MRLYMYNDWERETAPDLLCENRCKLYFDMVNYDDMRYKLSFSGGK
jgi:hypothetical protein